MGDSRGRWEGDTLVVDVTHFNDRTWFDMAGNFHTDALHVVERYTPLEAGHVMHYEATIEDKNVFTRPWKISLPTLSARRKEHPASGLRLRGLLLATNEVDPLTFITNGEIERGMPMTNRGFRMIAVVVAVGLAGQAPHSRSGGP